MMKDYQVGSSPYDNAVINNMMMVQIQLWIWMI